MNAAHGSCSLRVQSLCKYHMACGEVSSKIDCDVYVCMCIERERQTNRLRETERGERDCKIDRQTDRDRGGKRERYREKQ